MTEPEKLTIEEPEDIAKNGFLARHLANQNVMGLTAHIAEQLADTMRENERLREENKSLRSRPAVGRNMTVGQLHDLRKIKHQI
jgi:hypothetical protein